MAIPTRINRAVKQEALAGMVAEEAKNDARDGRMIRVLSHHGERVIGQVNLLSLNGMGEGSMVELLVPEGEGLGPPVAQVFRERYIRHILKDAGWRSVKHRPSDR